MLIATAKVKIKRLKKENKRLQDRNHSLRNELIGVLCNWEIQTRGLVINEEYRRRIIELENEEDV